MIRKHETTAEMVKRLLSVIEDRVEKSNRLSAQRSKGMESSLRKAAI